MNYVADTQTWVFYLVDRLPRRADEIFSGAEIGEAFVFIPQ
jgi:hypothetical protein